MTILLTILGCGSSGGVPRIGNDWGLCDPAEPRNRRRRCSLLVERIGDRGTTRVLIDTGPDLREQLLDANIHELDAVLYTHSHADHLHGIDDLRAFTVRSGQRTPVYMDQPTLARAQLAFGYCFETPPGSGYPPILDAHLIDIKKNIIVSGDGGDLVFQAIEVEHGEIMSLGFKVADAAYIPDISALPSDSRQALNDLDLLILDCLRRRPHPSHFCLEDAIDCVRLLQPRRAVFTNMHNDLDYQTLCRELPDPIIPAYDMMAIDLPGESSDAAPIPANSDAV